MSPVAKVEGERSKHQFHMYSNDRSHVGMIVMENIPDDGIGSLTGRSVLLNPFISENIQNTYLMPSYSSLHGCIKTLWFSTEITLVPVDYFTVF